MAARHSLHVHCIWTKAPCSRHMRACRHNPHSRDTTSPYHDPGATELRSKVFYKTNKTIHSLPDSPYPWRAYLAQTFCKLSVQETATWHRRITSPFLARRSDSLYTLCKLRLQCEGKTWWATEQTKPCGSTVAKSPALRIQTEHRSSSRGATGTAEAIYFWSVNLHRFAIAGNSMKPNNKIFGNTSWADMWRSSSQYPL